MNRFSLGRTSQGSICQSNTIEAAEKRIVNKQKQPLYSQRNYYKKNIKDYQYNQSQQSCSYAQQNYEQRNNHIEQEQYIECDWKIDFNEEGCNAQQIEEFAEGVSKIRTPYPSKKIKIKFQPNRQNIEKQQNKPKFVVKINSEKCIQQNSCSDKTGRKQIKLRSSRRKNQIETNGLNSEKGKNSINQQGVIQLRTQTHKQINKNNVNPEKLKNNLNYTQAINFCIANTINPNRQNQSNTKSGRDVEVLHSFMIDQQNVIRQNNDTTSDLKKDRMSSAKTKSIGNPKKPIKIINNFIEDELSQSETQQQNKSIKNIQKNELKILKVQKIRDEKQAQENECHEQTLREIQKRRKGSNEHRNENKFGKQEEQSSKYVEIKCFKKKKHTDSQISTNYQSKDGQEGTSMANYQKRKPEPDFHYQNKEKHEVRVPTDQSQNPQQYLQSPSHTSQPFIEQSYINKVISEMMMQNNEYLHRVNESVVNRLLSIIENQSQNGQSMMSSMKNSRWNNEQFIQNSNSRQQSFNNNSNMKGKVVRMQHNKSKSHQIQTSPKLQKNPQYFPATHIQLNGPLQVLANIQSRPSSIMVSLVNQNSQNQQMATQPSGSLNQTLKQQQLDLIKLESKRNRRSREFVQQREKQKYGTISDAQKTNDFTQTPRPSQPVGTNGNKNSDPNLAKNMPTISPIHNIQYKQSSQQITPCVSHNVSLANDNINENGLKKSLQNKQKLHEKSNNMKQNEKIGIQHKKPVFMEIPKDEQSSIGGGMSLAQAFKRKIGKLPSRQERRAKQMQNQQNDMPKDDNNKQLRPKQFNHQTVIKNTIMTSSTKPLRQTLKKQNTIQNQFQQQGNASNLQIDTQSLKGSKGVKNMYVTPKSCEPSEQLLNRLIGGSKAKISKKEMYALTRKNYQNLPEVRQKKKQEEKKQKQIQRLERIKQYQKSIRASKVTITSNSNN